MTDGQIVGASGKSAAIFFHRRLRDLGQFQDEFTEARFVNSHGVAVGDSAPRPTTYSRALLFKDGRIIDLGHLPDVPGSSAHIFNSASVIGETGEIYGVSGDIFEGFLVRFADGNVQPLNPILNNPAAGTIQNINSFGAFSVAFNPDYPDGPQAAFGNDATIHLLFPPFAPPQSSAAWINDWGQITGFRGFRAFMYSHGIVTYLPELNTSLAMRPTGINDSDEVVGNPEFVYRDGKTYDLHVYLPQLQNLTILPGITDRGAFVGTASDGHAYLIKPSEDVED